MYMWTLYFRGWLSIILGRRKLSEKMESLLQVKKNWGVLSSSPDKQIQTFPFHEKKWGMSSQTDGSLSVNKIWPPKVAKFSALLTLKPRWIRPFSDCSLCRIKKHKEHILRGGEGTRIMTNTSDNRQLQCLVLTLSFILLEVNIQCMDNDPLPILR